MVVLHSRPQSPSFLGHVVGKRGALEAAVTLLLNDRGINLFQFLFTLKRVLMKQMQIQQKKAFLLSTLTLTAVPKNILYI